MYKWKNFENQMVEYLKELLLQYDVVVKEYGKSNSTLPDVEIELKNKQKSFFLETKMPNSQSSQFVVKIDKNKFIYGKNNEFVSNKYSEKIINVLNQNFDLYKDVDQKGFTIPVSNEYAFEWIISNMKNKNIEFIISSNNKDDIIVFPIDKIRDFFNVKTILRRKRSGSQKISSKYYNDFLEQFKHNFPKINYKCEVINKKLFIYFDFILEKKELYISSPNFKNGKRYFLSKKADSKYEVRITSATNNPNIIFELSFKKDNDSNSFTIQSFLDYIIQID